MKERKKKQINNLYTHWNKTKTKKKRKRKFTQNFTYLDKIFLENTEKSN